MKEDVQAKATTIIFNIALFLSVNFLFNLQKIAQSVVQ